MTLAAEFDKTIKAIAFLYAMYIQGGIVGIAAVLAVTRPIVIAMYRYL